MFITRAISLTNSVVATSALGFQVFVLYPWHKQLSDDFEALKAEHRNVLTTVKDTVDTTTSAAAAAATATGKRGGIRDMLGSYVNWGV